MTLRISLPLLVLLAACGATSSADEAAILRLVQAPVVPGDRFGPLQLEETTLGHVVATFGPGTVSAVAGDATSFELRYLGGQLLLVFDLAPVIDGPLSPAVLRGALRDFAGFVDSRSEIGDARLTRIELLQTKDTRTPRLVGRFGAGPALGTDSAALFAACGTPIDGTQAPAADAKGTRRFQLRGLSAWLRFDGAGGSRVTRLQLHPDAQ